MTISVLRATATCYGVIDQQHHNSAHYRDNHAVNVQPGHSRCPEQIKKASNKSANDSKRNVEPKALALPIDYLAANETGDQAKGLSN
jgi:hypothetical protein